MSTLKNICKKLKQMMISKSQFFQPKAFLLAQRNQQMEVCPIDGYS